MNDFLFHKILVACDDLLHDCYGGAFCEFLMLFDEVVQSPMWTIFEHKVVEIDLFNDVIAFDDIGMV